MDNPASVLRKGDDILLTSWSHMVQEAEKECARLQPSPDRVGVLLTRPAESLAAARWLFPDAAIHVAVTPGRPSQMEISFQTPSITLVDWQEFQRFRQLTEHANRAMIQPTGDQLSVKLIFQDVWLEKPTNS